MSPTSQMILFMCVYQVRTGSMVILDLPPHGANATGRGPGRGTGPGKVATPKAICSRCLILTPCPPVHVVKRWPRWAAWLWPEPRQRKTPLHPATPVLLADRPRPSVALARGPYGGVAAHRARGWPAGNHIGELATASASPKRIAAGMPSVDPSPQTGCGSAPIAE